MLADPAVMAVTCPTLLTVATFGFELVQVAVAVTSFVVLSESVAIAERFIVVPVVMLAPLPEQPMPLQLIAMELATVFATVSVVLALRPPEAALIVVVPRFTAVARPLPSIVATLGDDDVHVAVLLMSLVVRSPNVPVAVNCCVLAVDDDPLCSVMAGFRGEMEIAARSCLLTKNFPQLS
jgi:hypothetical protein